MALQTTAEIFRTRFALPLDLLQAVLRDCEVAFGSLADMEAFADRVESPGTLADSVAATLRAVMSTEGMTLTRMEMLELLCIAVSGTDVESSGPALRRSLRRMLVFVNGVLLSMQEPLAKAAEEQEFAVARAHETGAESVEEAFETPENFYVLESFELVGRHAPFAGTAVSAMSVGSSARVAWAQTAESPESAEVLEPGTECLKCCSESQPAQDVVAKASPVFSPREEAVPEEIRTFAGAAVDKSRASKEASVWGEAEFAEEPEFAESNSAEADEPVARRHRFLSQPALMACAAVVAFGAGMLVPRSTPPRAKAVAPSERSHEDRQTAGSNDVATGASPESAGTLRLGGVPDPLPLPVSHPDAMKASTDTSGAQGPASVPPAFSAASATPLQPGSAALASVAPGSALAHLAYSPQPEYPALAKLTHVEGEVVLAIAVSTHGDVVGTRVLQGQPLLRGAAEAAVRRWRFQPFLEAGRPAEIQTSVVVDVRPPLQ